MDTLLGTIITKILAAIIALFMPFTSTAPAVSVSISKDANSLGSSAITSWDVSNSTSDNVRMYYYDEGSLLDDITATIKSVFSPITAFAAEEEIENDYVAPQKHDNGTVVIEGTGATKKYVFVDWLDYDKFVEYYEDWCERNNIKYMDYYIPYDCIDLSGNYFSVDALSASAAHRRYENLPENEQNQALLNELIPIHMSEIIEDTENFWTEYATYTPRKVIIRGGVYKINFASFAFCSSIEYVEIESTLVNIESGAFSHTNISKIVLPETVEYIGDAAFSQCNELEKIYIKGRLNYIGKNAFDMISEKSDIYCAIKATFDKFAGIEISPFALMAASDFEEEELATDLNERTRVVYSQDAFDALNNNQ